MAPSQKLMDTPRKRKKAQVSFVVLINIRSYPLGPARNPNSVQRGGVQFVSMYPGDPTTPGYPSYENSTRTKGENIPDIPSLPLSWANAKILFRTLNGSDALYGKRVRLVNNGESTGCLVFSFEWVTQANICSQYHCGTNLEYLGSHSWPYYR
jgi:hypothetical protein